MAPWGAPECKGYGDFHYDLGVAPDRAYEPPRLFENLLRNVYQTPTTCNALIRHSVVDAVGGFEEAFKGMFEDQVFFAKVLLDHPVFVSDRKWAKYRQHPKSSSALSAAADADEAARLRFLRWLASYVAGRDVGRRTRHELRRTMLEALWAFAKVRAGGGLRPAGAARWP